MYEYERQHALIITSSSYDKVKLENGQYLYDLPQAYGMGNFVEEKLKQLGFDEIIKVHDPSFSQLRKAMSTMNARINEDEAEDINGLLFVYYCGHGFYAGNSLHCV